MKKILGSLVLMLAMGASVQAEDDVVVVELYTSQGCSSCPPADALLKKLSGRSDVIALGLHVDYWDYLGWKDELASPGFTERQRAYARVARNRSIYTPQMVIGGKHLVIGHDAVEVMDFMRAERSVNTGVSVDLVRSEGRTQVTGHAIDGQKMVVVLVRYTPSVFVDIRRGENAGKTIEYANTVTEWQTIRSWNGASPLNLTLNTPGNDAVVVLVQEVGPGRILAAAQLR